MYTNIVCWVSPGGGGISPTRYYCLGVYLPPWKLLNRSAYCRKPKNPVLYTTLLISRLLKNVIEAARPRQKWPQKRGVLVVSEHLEAIFNEGLAMQVVFQQPVRVRFSVRSS